MFETEVQGKEVDGLLDGEEIASERTHKLSNWRQQKATRWLIISLLFNLGTIAVCVYLYTCVRYKSQSPFPQQIYSPSQDALEYKTVVFHTNAGDDKTIYQGPPSDEVDSAWEDLYRDIGISQIDRESALRLPNATVPIAADSNKYIVSVDVFHQLHCLNMIRKSLYPEHYGGRPLLVHTSSGLLNGTEEEDNWHLEHCVDSIRQSLMCSVDVSTIFWHWLPEEQRSVPSSRTTHTCRDFEKIKEWAIEHRLVENFDPKAIPP